MDLNRRSDDELRSIIKGTVRETLVEFGVDVSEPIQMQADFLYLRELRTVSESVRRKGILTIIVVSVAGFCGLVWLGVKQILSK